MEVAVWVGFSDPVPGVFKPLVSVVFALVGEPADFVVAPDEVHSDVLSWFAGGAEVVEFDDIWEGFAGPTAGGDSAGASVEDAVEVADFEDAVLGVVVDFIDSQGE